MMGFPGNIQEMMQKAKELQDNMAEMQKEIEQKEVEASAGGGMVTAKASGSGKITKVVIEKEVVNPEDIEMLQDLVKAAVNGAIGKSQDLMKEEMSKLTGGIPIPGFGK